MTPAPIAIIPSIEVNTTQTTSIHVVSIISIAGAKPPLLAKELELNSLLINQLAH
jgi:hypothetical protein